ncbi:hypothetical protein BpHYR1_051161 [Brachionus plicatilis]|uniref:Uncharacterized protein n=1 Tax=Brachionus plicatilis TaxID=10195 RepID=A0A3M7PSV8_BRAPC|nr:hypothetical protein BpHYR1_051161 [Brachionus plicatilis]
MYYYYHLLKENCTSVTNSLLIFICEHTNLTESIKPRCDVLEFLFENSHYKNPNIFEQKPKFVIKLKLIDEIFQNGYKNTKNIYKQGHLPKEGRKE